MDEATGAVKKGNWETTVQQQETVAVVTKYMRHSQHTGRTCNAVLADCVPRTTLHMEEANVEGRLAWEAAVATALMAAGSTEAVVVEEWEGEKTVAENLEAKGDNWAEVMVWVRMEVVEAAMEAEVRGVASVAGLEAAGWEMVKWAKGVAAMDWVTLAEAMEMEEKAVAAVAGPEVGRMALVIWVKEVAVREVVIVEASWGRVE